jgi:hypothetical protein
MDLPGVTICGTAYGQQATARAEALAPGSIRVCRARNGLPAFQKIGEKALREASDETGDQHGFPPVEIHGDGP